MKLSIIIPVYNEEHTVARLLERVAATTFDKQVIVVDDGSTDGTPAVLRALADERITVLRHARNLGKGAALRTGLRLADGEVTLVQDADLEYSPADYAALLEPILAGRSDVVYGSRILGAGQRGYLPYYLGGRCVSWLANRLYGTHLTDLPTGYKVFRTSLLRRIEWGSDGFGFCAEITARLARLGIQIVEVPIAYSPRTFAAGKKISWRSGVQALAILLRYRMWPPA